MTHLRRLLLTLVLVLVLPVLAACGADDEDPATTTGAAATAGAYPVTVTHSRGTTTIPRRPQRIVTLTDRDTDTVLALGSRPVGIRSIFGFETGVGPWAQARLGDAKPQVWSDREIDVERIAALRPDLIVNANSDGEAEDHERLQRIAPTLALPRGEVPFGASTSSTTLLIAKALGDEPAGRRLLQDVDGYLAQQKRQHPEFARLSASYLDFYDGGILAYSDRHVVNRSLSALGFRSTAVARRIPAKDVSAEVSPERLRDHAADVIVAYPYERTLQQVARQVPTLRSLDAFERDRVLLLDDLAFSAASVLSLRYGLERLVPRLARAAQQETR